MSMNLRYEGGFYSYSDVLYDVKIYQEGYSGAVTDVDFTDTPLTIEWQETDKLEPVQSSSAKLQLYSDSDRQFVDLYTVKAGSVRLDVYREGNLYWSGTLDPELYEEPFAYKTDYGVDLTSTTLPSWTGWACAVKGFRRFGILSRRLLRHRASTTAHSWSMSVPGSLRTLHRICWMLRRCSVRTSMTRTARR